MQFFSKNSCTIHDSRIGEYSFCEAVKVDVAELEVKNCKNQLSSRENQLSSTVSLLCVLFEDLGCALKLCKKCADNVTEQCFLDPKIYIFSTDKKKEMIVTILFFGRV